ncbi:MAG: VIT1/CCC1 transporter family protein [bacterium]
MLDTKKKFIDFQRCEITEHFIYKKLSNLIKDINNKDVLKRISDEELSHYKIWKRYTNENVKPNKFRICKYVLISRLLGLTFGIKLMEKGEKKAQINYDQASDFVSDIQKIMEDESDHEKELIKLIDEERLQYVGSMILGLNDALVELTGALAGFTLALQNTRLIAMAGIITGIAASLSMASSEYLSTKAEENVKNPIKASIYTGIAYIFTVFFLILPYLIFSNFYIALSATIINAIIVVLMFTYYISVAKDMSFKRRFTEMVFISLGVSLLTFGIGFLVRMFLHIDV